MFLIEYLQLTYLKYKMAKLKKNQIIGILLLIAVALIWAPIPIPSKSTIGSIIVLAAAIYQLIR